jgi:starch synthase (maltosyl-transferring)
VQVSNAPGRVRPLAPARVVVDVVAPVVDGGRFPSKGTIGEPVVVTADVYLDGHDHPAAALWYAPPDAPTSWTEVPMAPLGNDRWQAAFTPDRLGTWRFHVAGWHARFATWRAATQLKLAARQDVAVDLLTGAALVQDVLDAAELAPDVRDRLQQAVADFNAGSPGDWLQHTDLVDAINATLDREPVASSDSYTVRVDRERARFSSWYEFFPRPGTLQDAIGRLDHIAGLGFDVVYLPPIHPIGWTFRKGKNNTIESTPEDVGSPWAIGSESGGHTAVDPSLGTVDDVRAFADACRARGMELALDLAFQCSPDHPWVSKHPEWFKHRADGTIQYAENPPKKYQDIYPLDFEGQAWRSLWQELLDVVQFWIDQGVRTFRVDNPHTKPFAFWQWLIGEVVSRHPDVIFLAEAFTRPRVMERLAKLGFHQSYTYFTWRQSRAELQEYFGDLSTRTVHYFRPNAWPNTPDILTEQLQTGGRPAFVSRGILAATLSPSWGIYGPPYEVVEHRAVRPGSEEYLDSEKFQVREWDLDQPQTLAPLLTRLNEIRRRHPALQHLTGLRFHRSENDNLLVYTKCSPDGTDRVLVVVNVDPFHEQSGWVDIDLAALDLPYGAEYELHDELGGGTYRWTGPSGWVRLDPNGLPAHIFAVTGLDGGPPAEGPAPEGTTHR